MYETPNWPVIKARWFTPGPPRPARRRVRLVIIHDMEYPERNAAARAVAQYFATTDTQASAHICVDNRETIQCVMDNDVAWAAPGANHDGIQLELAGYARQTRAEWLDPYSLALLQLAAEATAQYCLKYELPVQRLTDAALKAGKRGIVSHAQVSRVYRKSDHMDPGEGFPWEAFLSFTSTWYDVHR